MLRHAVVLQGTGPLLKIVAASDRHDTPSTRCPRQPPRSTTRRSPDVVRRADRGGEAAADRPGPGRDWTIQLEDTASFQVGSIQDIVLVLTVAAMPAWP
jgi:hypothetical protein